MTPDEVNSALHAKCKVMNDLFVRLQAACINLTVFTPATSITIDTCGLGREVMNGILEWLADGQRYRLTLGTQTAKGTEIDVALVTV